MAMHTVSAARISDEQLVREAQSGDTGAWGLLWSRYEARVQTIVRSHVASPEDREDLAQEVLLRAVEALPRLRAPEQFRAWLDQVARRRCIDHLRRKQRVRFQSLEPFADDGDDMCAWEYPSLEPEVEDLVISRAIGEATEEALSELTDAGRQAFLMRASDDASLREISNAIGVTEGAAKSLVYRARRTLEKELTPFLAA
jgi:RNA polymerase sigma-70 factor, ECF subfamily